jgi:small membrane protein
MSAIQVILVSLALLAFVFGGSVFQSRLAYRLLALCLSLAGGILILFPDLTTAAAHSVGVGRGADLLLYLGIFAGVYAFLLLYTKARKLERQMTAQIRASAIRDAITSRSVYTEPSNK